LGKWKNGAKEEGMENEDSRLLAVKRARRVQHLLVDPRSFHALDVADRYAKGKATDEELATAHADAKLAAQSMEYLFEKSIEQSDLSAALMSAKRNVEWGNDKRSKAWAVALSTAEVFRLAAEQSAAQAASWASDSDPVQAAEKAAHWSTKAAVNLSVSEFARRTARFAEWDDNAGLGLVPLQQDKWSRTLNAVADAAISEEMERRRAEMDVHTSPQADPDQGESVEGFVATRDEDWNLPAPSESKTDQAFDHLVP
jgi:hypothetical protein